MPWRHRRREGAAEAGPNWLITYSDTITLLLAFFVLLYAFSEVDLARFRAIVASLRASLGLLPGGQTLSDLPGLNNAPILEDDALASLKQEMMQIQQVYETVYGRLAATGLADSVSLEVEERGLVVRFADRVLFDLGQARLKDEARAALDLVAGELARIPNPIRVEGHTDNLPIHNERYPSNWELSVARATRVVRYFIEEHGLPPQRLSAAGYGEYYPVAPNTTAAGRARNRRVDIVVLRLGLAAAEPGSGGGN